MSDRNKTNTENDNIFINYFAYTKYTNRYNTRINDLSQETWTQLYVTISYNFLSKMKIMLKVPTNCPS